MCSRFGTVCFQLVADTSGVRPVLGSLKVGGLLGLFSVTCSFEELDVLTARSSAMRFATSCPPSWKAASHTGAKINLSCLARLLPRYLVTATGKSQTRLPSFSTENHDCEYWPRLGETEMSESSVHTGLTFSLFSFDCKVLTKPQGLRGLHSHGAFL